MHRVRDVIGEKDENVVSHRECAKRRERNQFRQTVRDE